MDLDDFEGFEILEENRAIGAWQKILRQLHNIFRLRRIWAFVGIYLQTYRALR